MGDKTKIDWADATWNPVTGCLHGCEYCYARRIAERFGGCSVFDPVGDSVVVHNASGKELICELNNPVSKVDGIDPILGRKVSKAPYPFGFAPTLHRYRLDIPARWTKPRNIFVCSMADLFGDWVPDKWIQEVFQACDKAAQHRYLFLTKNPDRYLELSRLMPKHRRPPNVAEMWFGQSFTGEKLNYTPLMLPPWQNCFISIEPLLRNLSRAEAMDIAATNGWVIVGAETGHRNGKVIPKKSWIDDIAAACEEMDTPIFMKESLRELMESDFRQEFPWEG